MSFSTEVKQELVSLRIEKSCCMLSELNALTQSCASMTLHGRGQVSIAFSSENVTVAKRVFILLKKRLENLDGRRSCTLECRLADVQLSLAEYDRAEKTLEDLTARWPQREAPWVLRLRLAAALRDGAAIQKTLRQIEEKEVYLSAKGREIVRFWQGEQQ